MERKKVENKKRARQVIFDIARSNSWDWFITLTFSPDVVDRYEYDECTALLRRYTNHLGGWYGCQWLIVPDRHKDSAYHFHGLVRGGRLPVTPAVSRHGVPHVDGSGRQIYNLSTFKGGFSSATAVTDQKRVATYITKYLTKDLNIPKGKKCYWASRSLARPVEEYLVMSPEERDSIVMQSSFCKVVPSDYGDFLLCEVREDEESTEYPFGL